MGDVTRSPLPGEPDIKPRLLRRSISVPAGFVPISIQSLLPERFSGRHFSRKKAIG